jgi:uncharacterized protein YbjQ (UPF0145 family)
MDLFSANVFPTYRSFQVGELIYASAVIAANITKDARSYITNLIGGPMPHYQELLNKGIESAIAELKTKAKKAGYDGVMGIRISHPSVTEGAVEVIIVGNGFNYVMGE